MSFVGGFKRLTMSRVLLVLLVLLMVIYPKPMIADQVKVHLWPALNPSVVHGKNHQSSKIIGAKAFALFK